MAALADVLHLGEVQSTTPSEDWRTVYDFWFPPGLDLVDLETHHRIVDRWFAGGANAELPPFAHLVEAAASGELNRWLATPLGSLCLIIVLDQFPRGLFAGTGKAFVFDPLALAVAEEGLRNGHYDALVHSWEKVFFALPLIHAEGPDHLDRADRSVALAQRRVAEGPPNLRSLREFGLSQTRGHRDVIARFGRHPHRNAILARESTAEEAVYIEQGDFVHNRRPSLAGQCSGSRSTAAGHSFLSGSSR
jgi:uncharacterized protein (DUF924 family)